MKKSLKGKWVVITRSAEGAEPWKKYLEKQGARVYFFPTIEIAPAKLTSQIKNTLKNIADFDWVIFTSAAGVRSFNKFAKKNNISKPSARMPKIAVIGDATARPARTAGYKIAFQPSTPSSAALAFELEPVQGRSILLLRSPLAARDLFQVLTARGAKVTDLAMYQVALRRDPDPKFEKLLTSGKIDFLTFASPSAVHGFFQRTPKALHKKVLALPVIAIGPGLAALLKKGGFTNIRIAEQPTIDKIAKTML